jgi:hypothetical protein
MNIMFGQRRHANDKLAVMTRPQNVPTLLLALYLSVAISSVAAQEYTFGQATWYDSIYNG